MGAASGAHTLGNLLDSKSPLGAAWGAGLGDLEVHGYEPVKELNISAHAAVVVVRKRGRPEQQFVAKAFTSCNAADLAKAEAGPLQEAMLLRSLEHPNIVKYVEAWWTPEQAGSGRLSLIMEHAEDGDLHTPRLAMLRQGKQLDEVLIGRWLRQTLEALVHLHDRGIAHRDLKTSNVFLKDSWASALLGDFGISSVLAHSTFDKKCAGTPAYMSPEAVRSERYSTAVDIWAVGIILYELMALQLPFVGTLVALVYKICCSEARESPLRDAGYSEELVSLVTKVLAKDASARPTAAQLLNDEFWSRCCLDKSEGLAQMACSSNRSSLLIMMQCQKKDTLVDTTTGGFVPPVLQSWSSSEPTWGGGSSFPLVTPDHGTLSPGPRFDFDFYDDDEDSVTRSACPTPSVSRCATDVDVGVLGTGEASAWTDADEALREELQAAHAAGLVMSPEYLEALLARLGASSEALLA